MSEKAEGIVAVVLAIFCFCSGATAVIATVTMVRPREVWNNRDKAVELLIKDIQTSISRKREFFYIALDDVPGCPMIKSILTGELRSVVVNAAKEGMDIRVIIDSESVTRQKVKEVLGGDLPLQFRMIDDLSLAKRGFHISGSFVNEEILCLEDGRRKLRRYPYAPSYVSKLKAEFGSLWDIGQPI